jgi:hydrogenase maturation factor
VNSKPWRMIGAAAALAVIGVTPAAAHHSFALFNAQKNLALEGTVKEFQWTNPHVWIQLIVTDASGKDVEWSIDAASASSLARQGWSRQTLKPGDRVAVVVHPLKDGTDGGSLVSASLNGQQIGTRS